MPAWLWVWGPAFAQMVAIFILSNQPKLPSLPGGLTSYTGHLIGYAILGAAMLRAVVGARWSGVTPRLAVIAWALSTAYGVTDELHQSFVPGRVADLGDLRADAVGAAAGVAACWAWGIIARRSDV